MSKICTLFRGYYKFRQHLTSFDSIRQCLTSFDSIRFVYCIHRLISPQFDTVRYSFVKVRRILQKLVESQLPSLFHHTNIIPLYQKSKQKSFDKCRQNPHNLLQHTFFEMSRTFHRKFRQIICLINFSQAEFLTAFFDTTIRQNTTQFFDKNFRHDVTRFFDTKFRHYFSTKFFV